MKEETQQQLIIASVTALRAEGVEEAKWPEVVAKANEILPTWVEEGRVSLTGLYKFRSKLNLPPIPTHPGTLHKQLWALVGQDRVVTRRSKDKKREELIRLLDQPES